MIRSPHSERKKEVRVLHRPREKGGRRIRVQYLFRPDAGKPSDRMKSSSHKGTRTNSSVGNRIEPQGDLKDKQKEEKTTALAKENQEETGHLGRQHKVPESNEHKETMQRDRKPERRLLFLIAAGTYPKRLAPAGTVGV